MQHDLPEELATWTGPVLALERPPQGGYYDVTILTAQRGRFVLKVGRNRERVAELHAECRVLTELLDEPGFVPHPVAHLVAGESGLFLFSCVEGENLLAVLEGGTEAGRHPLMKSLGRALREVHGWRPAGPQPIDWMGEALAAASRNVASGAVANPTDHSGEFGGRDAHELLCQVQRWLDGVAVDLVYGHGDFCLPNALADQGSISGVVDWSRGGYRDRRIDLASAVWSIRHNLQDESCVRSFLEAYGYTAGAESLRPFEALWVLS